MVKDLFSSASTYHLIIAERQGGRAVLQVAPLRLVAGDTEDSGDGLRDGPSLQQGVGAGDTVGQIQSPRVRPAPAQLEGH